jgi:hypothetical protein
MTRPTKSAIAELYAIMLDTSLEFRHRHNASVSASRVEPLALEPGTPEPPAVTFLRATLNPDNNHPPQFRREAGAALAYFERRHAKASLKFNVDNSSETRTAWSRILNAAIRAHLWKHHRWPADKHLLITPNQITNLPAYPPETALSAILSPQTRKPARRKALDQPDSPTVTSPEQRQEILRFIAQTIHAHLYPEAADQTPANPEPGKPNPVPAKAKSPPPPWIVEWRNKKRSQPKP